MLYAVPHQKDDQQHTRVRRGFSYIRHGGVVSFSTTSHAISSKPTLLLHFHHSFKSYFLPCLFHTFSHILTLILYSSCCFSVSCSAFLYPHLPPFFHHRQWCLLNITLIHPSFKCRHYGYQMHLWLFRPIDWHNQYVILGKFGDTTLELPDALKALSSNLYGDGC